MFFFFLYFSPAEVSRAVSKAGIRPCIHYSAVLISNLVLSWSEHRRVVTAKRELH